ncbi:9596_t:CDS:2, partial [Entrophospora sp. SA101]
LSKLTVKVSLTADIWTSISNQAYFDILNLAINHGMGLRVPIIDK